MRTQRYPFTATHQTADCGRVTEVFETAEEFEAFVKENERWITSTSTPENYKRK